jgi:hypothetical protein
MVFDFKNAVSNMAAQEQEDAENKNNSINFQNFKSKESGNTDNTNQAQEMGYVDTAVDMAASGASGFAKGLTYTLDLPFYLGQALNTGKGYVVDLVGNAMNLEEEDLDQIKKELLILSKGESKFLGEYIREKGLTYEPKTNVGRYTEAAAEFAAPASVFAKG